MNSIIFDIETTGLDYKSDKIIQISAVKFNTKFKVLGHFDSYIKIDSRVPEFITDLTGLTDEQLLIDGREFDSVIKDFNDFLKDVKLVIGHNIKKFDYLFLKDYVDFNKYTLVDTLELSRKYSDTNKHSMNHLIKFYNIKDFGTEHNALNDCYYELELFRNIINIRNSK